MSVYGGGLFSFFSGQKKYNGGNNTEICMYNYNNYGNSCWFASYIQFLKSSPFFYEIFEEFLTEQKDKKNNSFIKIKLQSDHDRINKIEKFDLIYYFINSVLNNFTCNDNKINKEFILSVKEIYGKIDAEYERNQYQQYDAYFIYEKILIPLFEIQRKYSLTTIKYQISYRDVLNNFAPGGILLNWVQNNQKINLQKWVNKVILFKSFDHPDPNDDIAKNDPDETYYFLNDNNKIILFTSGRSGIPQNDTNLSFENVNIFDYLPEQITLSNNDKYNLKSFVEYHGILKDGSGGHYRTYSKFNNTWYVLDDISQFRQIEKNKIKILFPSHVIYEKESYQNSDEYNSYKYNLITSDIENNYLNKNIKRKSGNNKENTNEFVTTNNFLFQKLIFTYKPDGLYIYTKQSENCKTKNCNHFKILKQNEDLLFKNLFSLITENHFNNNTTNDILKSNNKEKENLEMKIIEQEKVENASDHQPLLVEINQNIFDIVENKEKENYKIDVVEFHKSNIIIEFVPFEKTNNASDMIYEEFYNYKNADYYLTNGANSNISSSGGGTTGAFNTIGSRINGDVNLLFDNPKLLHLGSNHLIIDSQKKYTYNSVYYTDVNKSYLGKNIRKVYHILGINYNNTNILPKDLKDENKNQESVMNYYYVILCDFYNCCLKGNVDLSIIHLASIPGQLYGGTISWKGMIKAVQKFKNFADKDKKLSSKKRILIILDCKQT